MGLSMSNVVRFPIDRRVPVTTIPRAEFERLAGLALDVVEQIVTLLDEQDAEAGEGAGQPAWCPQRPISEVVFLRGTEHDLDH